MRFDKRRAANYEGSSGEKTSKAMQLCGNIFFRKSPRLVKSVPFFGSRSSQRDSNRETEDDVAERLDAYYSRWSGHGIELPKIADGVRDFLVPVELSKDEDYLIDPQVPTISMGLGWDRGAKVDSAAVLFCDRSHVVDTVLYKKPRDGSDSVVHFSACRADRRTTDVELINVNLERLPLHVHHIAFIVYAYDTDTSFNEIQTAYIRMIQRESEPCEREMCSYHMRNMYGDSLMLGLLTRKGGYWNFRAEGFPTTGRTVHHFLKDPENLAFLAACPSQPPIFRNITVNVLRASDLTPGDSFGRFKKTQLLPDPYYEIRYKGKAYASNHVIGSLDPVWKYVPFDLGPVTDTEQKALKITVFSYDPVCSDGFLGTLRIPARALFNAGLGEHELSFPLGPWKTKGQHNDDVTGMVHLRLAVTGTQ